jgi:hypothetical protein
MQKRGEKWASYLKFCNFFSSEHIWMHDATWCQKLEADLVAQKTMGISEKVQFGILSMQP